MRMWNWRFLWLLIHRRLWCWKTGGSEATAKNIFSLAGMVRYNTYFFSNYRIPSVNRRRPVRLPLPITLAVMFRTSIAMQPMLPLAEAPEVEVVEIISTKIQVNPTIKDCRVIRPTITTTNKPVAADTEIATSSTNSIQTATVFPLNNNSSKDRPVSQRAARRNTKGSVNMTNMTHHWATQLLQCLDWLTQTQPMLYQEKSQPLQRVSTYIF